jgi:hypothetical protein
MFHEQAPRGLVSKLNSPLLVNNEKSSRRVIEDGFKKAVGSAQLLPLIAQLTNGPVQGIADLRESTAGVPKGEALGKISEANRFDETGQLQVCTVNVVPEASCSADAREAGNDPHRT